MLKLVLLPTLLLLCCQELRALHSNLSNGAVQSHDISPGDKAPMVKNRQTRQAGGCGCTADIYDSGNYGGRVLRISQQNADFTNDFFNDRVESIRLHGNCRWIFYENTNFDLAEGGQGSTHLLRAGYYASAPSWGGRGNQISSARALPPDGTKAIALFQHLNFAGRMLVLYSSSNHLQLLDFGDHVSSVIVIGGTWTLYQHDSYQGMSSRLAPGEYPSIHSLGVGADSVSSVRRNN